MKKDVLILLDESLKTARETAKLLEETIERVQRLSAMLKKMEEENG